MSLTTINNGELADASVVNDNFEYLDNRISLTNSTISTIQTDVQALSQKINAFEVGDIIFRLNPSKDAEKHLLDGALLRYGSYKAVIDEYAELYGDGTNIPSYFTDETTWQSSVTTYGVCGKFVYDSINNTLRLPKVTGFIEGTLDATALGDLVEAGLPNITGSVVTFDEVSGAFYDISNRGNIGGSGITTVTRGFDASRSSSIYGNSNTVQPQAIKGYLYIVIATSTKTDIQVDIDEIATDLNGKADVDLSNCTKPYIIETYENGQSGYNLYSNGYCEQWGGIFTSAIGPQSITLMKAYKDTNYNVIGSSAMDSLYASVIVTSTSTIKLETRGHDYSSQPCWCYWTTKGYVR